VDNVVYGPVDLPTLVGWIKEERVTENTWVYSEKDECWRKASQVVELRMFFRKAEAPTASSPAKQPGDSGVSEETAVFARKPGSLRRVKIFADMTDEQLSRFVVFMHVQRVKQFNQIVKQGDHGDAMYLVLEGELRVRMMIGGKETILVTLGPGEFFGEISLFDHGPRSADVLANQDSLLLKISSDSFLRLVSEAPDLAAPFLFAMSKTLTARIRADNKRYRDTLNFARAAGQQTK
jgi:CRP-like cAMP-binding protein